MRPLWLFASPHLTHRPRASPRPAIAPQAIDAATAARKSAIDAATEAATSYHTKVAEAHVNVT